MANQYNANGKKEGLWVKYYESGAVKEEKNYVNGVREGEYKCYYPNGNIETKKNIIKMEIFMDYMKLSFLMEQETLFII